MVYDEIPFEIKCLIYNNASLPTVKSLRFVSKSWASAGLLSLLLPTFSLKTMRDLQRLEDLGASEGVAAEAKRVVKELVMNCDGWEPRYFRNIVCSRHELRRQYESIDFVPSESESLALAELDQFIAQKELYTAKYTSASFQETLRHVSSARSVRFICRNQFNHPILRKCWEEYSTQAFEPRGSELQFIQMHHILSSPLAPIQHLRHEQILPTFFTTSKTLHSHITKLQTLSFNICDLDDGFGNEQELLALRDFITAAAPNLSSLSLTIESLGRTPLTFLPPPGGMPKLETLSLGMITLSPSIFIPFLASHESTLRRLRLCSITIPEGGGSVRSFLTSCQDIFCGGQLEVFQVVGMTRSEDTGNREQWLLGPFKDEDASVWQHRHMRNPRVKELEDFIVRGASWPMLESDSLNFG